MHPQVLPVVARRHATEREAHRATWGPVIARDLKAFSEHRNASRSRDHERSIGRRAELVPEVERAHAEYLMDPTPKRQAKAEAVERAALGEKLRPK